METINLFTYGLTAVSTLVSSFIAGQIAATRSAKKDIDRLHELSKKAIDQAKIDAQETISAFQDAYLKRMSDQDFQFIEEVITRKKKCDCQGCKINVRNLTEAKRFLQAELDIIKASQTAGINDMIKDLGIKPCNDND